MNNFTIPEKYQEDFQKALDTAVTLQTFTDESLAKALSTSRLNAAIFIGFMDKYRFIYPSPKRAEKTVCISKEEWESIGKNINAYTPPEAKEEETEEFFLTPVPKFSGLYDKSVEVKKDKVVICDDIIEFSIDKDSILLPEFKKATFFKKGYIDFGVSQSSFTKIYFKRGTNDTALALFESIKCDLDKKM